MYTLRCYAAPTKYFQIRRRREHTILNLIPQHQEVEGFERVSLLGRGLLTLSLNTRRTTLRRREVGFMKDLARGRKGLGVRILPE